MIGLFALPFSIQKMGKRFFEEVGQAKFDSINLCMKYHASRHLSIRFDGTMINTRDGEHFYRPDPKNYWISGSVPTADPIALAQDEVEEWISLARTYGLKLGAWSVFLHDSQFGSRFPDSRVRNLFHQSIIPNLCIANPIVQSYVKGHTQDLINLGFSHIAFESIAYGGFRHLEHQERYFVDLSPITEFLLSICFCEFCREEGIKAGLDLERIRLSLSEKVLRSLNSTDTWLGLELTYENVLGLFGEDMRKLLDLRMGIVSKLHTEIASLVRSSGIRSRYLDGSPISNRNASNTYIDLWQSGIQRENLVNSFDSIEPLLYRFSTEENFSVGKAYVDEFGVDRVVGAIRPAFPDLQRPEDLIERVHMLLDLTNRNLDFYMFEIIRDSEFRTLANLLNSSS